MLKLNLLFRPNPYSKTLKILLNHYGVYSNVVMDVIDIVSLTVQIILAVAAIVFGVAQTRINQRLKNLQDHVTLNLTVAEDADNIALEIRNVGGINVFLHLYEMGRIREEFKRAVLIAVDQSNTCYRLLIRKNDLKLINNDTEFILKLYITDRYGKKYISEHRVEKDTNGKVVVATYQPQRLDWQFTK